MNKTIFDLIVEQGAIEHPAEFKDFQKITSNYISYSGLSRHASAIPLGAYSSVWSIPTLLGMEVEVENMGPSHSLPAYWQVKGDGSLRNDGIEFTNFPLPPKEAMQATALLWLMLENLSRGRKPDFSWRTSVQIHVNVLDLKEEEFRRFLTLAYLFERVLFSVAGDGREESIFCTPLAQCTVQGLLSRYLRKKVALHAMAKAWPKYTAVNLFRLFASQEPPSLALGTVEFRHFGGTREIERVFLWQALVLRLFDSAVAISTDELLEAIHKLRPEECNGFANRVLTPPIVKLLGIKNFAPLLMEMGSRTKGLYVVPTKMETVLPTSALAKAAERKWKQRLVPDKKPKPQEDPIQF